MIRAANPAELPTIDRLQRLVLPYDTPADTCAGRWWIARDPAGLPIGFAGMVQSSRWIDAAYLCRAGVLARARGNGLQRRLIAVRERHAKRIGMRWLITDTHANPASANSLIGCGFRLYEPAHAWAANGALYWRKRIA